MIIAPLAAWALVAVQVFVLASDPSNAFVWAMTVFTTGCAVVTTAFRA